MNGQDQTPEMSLNPNGTPGNTRKPAAGFPTGGH